MINVQGLFELQESFSVALEIYISTIALKANKFDFNIIHLSIINLATPSQIVLIYVEFAEFELLALLFRALERDWRVIVGVVHQTDGTHSIEKLLLICKFCFCGFRFKIRFTFLLKLRQSF